jgi:hypothetical protein
MAYAADSPIRFRSFPAQAGLKGEDNTPPDSPKQANTPLENHMERTPPAETPGTRFARNMFGNLEMSPSDHGMREPPVRKLFLGRKMKTLQTAAEAANKRVDASCQRQKADRRAHLERLRILAAAKSPSIVAEAIPPMAAAASPSMAASP